jgi:hypothetical protein
MIKRVLLTFLQFLVFVGLLFAGGFWPLVRLFALGTGNSLVTWLYKVPVWKMTLSATHFVNMNGYIYASALLVLILLIEGVRRKFHPWMALSMLAYVLALLVSLYQKYGSVTIDS